MKPSERRALEAEKRAREAAEWREKELQRQAKKAENIEAFAKKALKVKSGNIIANVALSSFLLAVGLPKLTFYLRKLVTGSDAEPGLVKNA